MAEVEIHTAHHGHEDDPLAPRVGVLVGIIGILLAGVTIESHRAHTAAIVHKTEANDQWAFYQAKKIRGHLMDVGVTLLDTLSTDEARSKPQAEKLHSESERYAKDAEGIKQVAEQRDAESEAAERRALRFDLGEGFLELGLVLSSLYFLSRRRFFPVIGVSAALIGTVLGITGLLV